jgi:hypothetical protein
MSKSALSADAAAQYLRGSLVDGGLLARRLPSS